LPKVDLVQAQSVDIVSPASGGYIQVYTVNAPTVGAEATFTVDSSKPNTKIFVYPVDQTVITADWDYTDEYALICGKERRRIAHTVNDPTNGDYFVLRSPLRAVPTGTCSVEKD
jgi:hypothetical protein